MLTVTVELLHGTIRAGSADGLAAAGEDDRGEWPPSPARLLSAFVAADGTRDRCRATTGAELRALEVSPPPLIRADTAGALTTTSTATRYVVIDRKQAGTVQNYPARGSAEVRAARRAAPPHPHISYVWPDLEPSADDFEALRRRAARIGYFGCADSPARVHVTTEVPEWAADLPTWEPVDSSGADRVALPVPFDGLIDALDDAFDQFAQGVPFRRSWAPSVRRFYTDRPDLPHSYLVWLRLSQAFTGRRVLTLTSTLRDAVISHYGEAVGAGRTDVPDVVVGHGYEGVGYHHAHWLALPDVGHPHARGRIHGMAVWLPSDTSPEVVAGVRSAAGLVCSHGLNLPGGQRISLTLSDGGEGPSAATARRWIRPARTWISAFPVVHERWGGRRGLTLDEVARWCVHAGHPAPVAFDSSPVPLLDGAPSLRAHEVHRANAERRPFSHLRVHFAEPLQGPIVLGRARQFGLGLMAPDPAEAQQ